MKSALFSTIGSCLLFSTFFSACQNARSQNQDPQDHVINENADTPPPDNDNIPKGSLEWYVRPQTTQLVRGFNGEYYLYINLKTGAAPEEHARTPLNVSLVIDRSGSMEGNKMIYAKKAANFVISQLNQDDILSIVNYDDEIEVSSPAGQVRNKESLKKKIDNLTSRGSTNLTGGMHQGYDEVKKFKRDGYVNRVLLLTDGLANVGITEPSAIKKIVSKKYMEEGIALSTFGIGADYNEDLLTMMAETGRANYYFIGQADKIPEIFAKELKGLLSVLAQNAKVEVELPYGWSCQNVYGYPFETAGNKVTVRFNDLYSNDEKAILVKLRTNQQQMEGATFNCTLSYTGTIDNERKTRKRNITVPAAANMSTVKYDPVVEEMIAMFTATEEFDVIMADVDNGNYKDAKVKAEVAVRKLKEQQLKTPSARLQKQEEALSGYAVQMDSIETMKEDEKKIYQKSNKSMNYNTRKMK